MTSYVSRYLRVYLLDDHDIVRRGLSDLLMSARDINVVGDGGSARDAPRAILGLDVDVVLLDLRLQDGTGIEVCREVRSANPSITGLLLTSSDEDEALVATVLAGAAGYVIKVTRGSDIISAIRRVGAGKPLIDQATSERVRSQLLTEMDQLRPALVDDERRMLTHVVHGLTNAQIAERMGMSVESATTQVSGLVDRIIDPAFGDDATADSPPPGKHRRSDG